MGNRRRARGRPLVCEHMFVRWSNLSLGDEEQRRLPGYRDEAVVRHFDAPEALETNFYEVRAKSVLNRVPGKSQMPFRWTINVIEAVRMRAFTASLVPPTSTSTSTRGGTSSGRSS